MLFFVLIIIFLIVCVDDVLMGSVVWEVWVFEGWIVVKRR